MKTLSQLLDDMPSKSLERTPNTSNTPRHGSMANVGTTNISPQVYSAIQGIMQAVRRGLPLDDQALETSLAQHFGSRLVIKRKVRPFYGDHGYDQTVAGISVSLDGVGDGEGKFLEALEYLNRPARPEQIAGCFARMRTALARAAESATDIEVLIDTMTGLCRDYPADAIMSVTNDWLRTHKWFPVPFEFIALLDRAVMLRQSLLEAFKAGSQSQITHQAEKPLPRQERAKAQWSEDDWHEHIADAEKMVELATASPHMLDVEGWKAEVDKRKAERDAKPN